MTAAEGTRGAEVAGLLDVLRTHSIGAFNGSQSACARCRRWMTHDEYRQHLADLLADHVRRAKAEALREAADEMASSADGIAGLDSATSDVALAYLTCTVIDVRSLRDRADRIETKETP